MSQFNESSTEETALATTEPTAEESDEEACEHDHAHDHAHDSCPAERLVTPADIFDIDPTEESIIIIGTQQKKVTKITGLDGMVQLKVAAVVVFPMHYLIVQCFIMLIGTCAAVLFDKVYGRGRESGWFAKIRNL